MKAGKVFLIAGGALAIILGAKKLSALNNFQNATIQVLKSNKNPDIVDFDILKLNPGSLRLFIDINILNPNTQNYTITKPYIKVSLNNNQIGVSTPDATVYNIKANSTTKIEQIEIKIPLTYLIGDAISFVKNYISTGKITKLNKNLVIEAQTKLNNIAINKQFTYAI